MISILLPVLIVTTTYICGSTDALQTLADQSAPGEEKPTIIQIDDTPRTVKRTFISLNGGLRNVVENIIRRYMENRSNGNYSFIKKRLFALGKRGVTSSDDDDGEIISKRQRLSVNGALSSLADMIAANDHRRLREEVASNHQRLLGLGK